MKQIRSPKTGRCYFVATSTKPDTDTEQYELADDGTGKVGAKKVRSWRIGPAEPAVADDRSGKLHIGEERRGIWEVGGEPTDPTPGELIIRVGQNGLVGDIEGLTLYVLPDGDGYRGAMLDCGNNAASSTETSRESQLHGGDCEPVRFGDKLDAPAVKEDDFDYLLFHRFLRLACRSHKPALDHQLIIHDACTGSGRKAPQALGPYPFAVMSTNLEIDWR